jgi:hypothetical protein
MVHSSTGERGTGGNLFRLLVGKQNLLLSLLLHSSCLLPGKALSLLQRADQLLFFLIFPKSANNWNKRKNDKIHSLAFAF